MDRVLLLLVLLILAGCRHATAPFQVQAPASLDTASSPTEATPGNQVTDAKLRADPGTEASRNDETGDTGGEVSPCPEPLVPFEGESCLALPHDAHAETPVIVYLHGMTSTPEMARMSGGILANAAVGRGFAVLALLGERGNCTWKPEVMEHLCWPTDLDQHEAVERMLAKLDSDLRAIQLRLGRASPIRPILVGYSNGGFMAMRLVARVSAPFSTLVVVHAGAPKDYVFPSDLPLPIFLRAARDDRWHFPTMEALRETLQAKGWSPEWAARDGEHRFTESDAAAIVEFLTR